MCEGVLVGVNERVMDGSTEAEEMPQELKMVGCLVTVCMVM